MGSLKRENGYGAGLQVPVGEEVFYQKIHIRSDDNRGFDQWKVFKLKYFPYDDPIYQANRHNHVQILNGAPIGWSPPIEKAVEEGEWKTRFVQSCRVDGCQNPQPLDKSVSRRDRECVDCYHRQVVACRLCQRPDPVRKYHKVRERLLEEQLCHRCDFWESKDFDDPRRVINEDYNVFYIGDEDAGGARGFAGRTFSIQWYDRELQVTSNLWHNGQIPEFMRHKYEPNAIVR